MCLVHLCVLYTCVSCTPVCLVHLCILYTSVSCTPVYLVHLCVLYTCVSCTPVCLVHLCILYTCVSCTPVCLVHLCILYTCVSCTPVYLVHLCVLYTCVSCTPVCLVHLCVLYTCVSCPQGPVLESHHVTGLAAVLIHTTSVPHLHKSLTVKSSPTLSSSTHPADPPHCMSTSQDDDPRPHLSVGTRPLVEELFLSIPCFNAAWMGFILRWDCKVVFSVYLLSIFNTAAVKSQFTD